MPKIITDEIFIGKAKKVHKDLYDYSLVSYKKAIVPVQIIGKRD